MQFIDLEAQQKMIKEQINQSISAVMQHGIYIMGPEVFKLEKELSEFSKVRHAIACASGTDALLLALMAKNTGPGDAILTTPFTFISTAEVICQLGATPVFVDIEPDTFNIDPNKIKLTIRALMEPERYGCPLPKLASKKRLIPKGIISVNLFGLPANYNSINHIANKYDLFVIEDAAQSFGAEYNGKKSCSLTEIGCTSFFPAKPLGCYGDGGMCFTNNDELAEVIQSIRNHGKGTDKYDNIRIGINSRLDTLQAGILLEKFKIFPQEITLRRKIAYRYNELLNTNNRITTPQITKIGESVWAQYSILAENKAYRNDIQNKLRSKGIPTAIYYPKPLHLQTAFNALSYKAGAFPVSEDISKRIFSIPMHPYLKESEQKNIVYIINNN